MRPDGTLQIEAKYTLQSDDGVLIMITNRPSQYYVRRTARFEARVGSKYARLNDSVFAGVAERQANAAIIRFFEVK